jgi:hypothetical protein
MRATGKRWTIACYAPPHAFATGTRAALVSLGYRVVAAATRGSFDDSSWRADVRVADERHLHRLPKDSHTPIVALSSQRPRPLDDPRVLGVVQRPVKVCSLYPLLQRALESHPRRAARAPTQIPARGNRADRRFSGEVLSLSAMGCLFRTQSELEPGLELNLMFPLPLGRMVSTRAQVLTQRGEEAGLAFHHPSADTREAIADYVTRRLATL